MPEATGGARLELIDLLARQNSKEELLAELLPLEADNPKDLATRTKLGQLFLLADSPSRAAGIFRGILHESANNAVAYDGMGCRQSLTKANIARPKEIFRPLSALPQPIPWAATGLIFAMSCSNLIPRYAACLLSNVCAGAAN